LDWLQFVAQWLHVLLGITWFGSVITANFIFILRGTVFGQVRSLDALTTTYGLTWLVALVAATGTFAWGKLVLEPAIDRMNAIPADEALLPDGRMSPAMAAAVDSLKRLGGLELIGFLVIFTCMILMRFGY
jgi:hypothetical protein